jgi:hypothetical protein
MAESDERSYFKLAFNVIQNMDIVIHGKEGRVMKIISVITAVFGVLFVLGLCAVSVQSAQAITFEYVTPSGSTTSDGSVKAKASFTLENSSITLTLTNLLQNPKADGQLINGIRFDVSGASGSGLLITTNSGNISETISADGTYTAGTSDQLLRWKANESGNTIVLTTLTGGKPNRLIIGPDSAGGFNPVFGKQCKFVDHSASARRLGIRNFRYNNTGSN